MVEKGGAMPRAQRARPERGPDKALTGVSRYTLAAAAKTGHLPARKLGSQWIATLAAAETWLREARHRPGPVPQRKPVVLVSETQEGEALAA
jgi:hypothetical protein